jgi:hypothetical protein
MTTLVVTEEQASIIKQAGCEVEIVSPQGERLGVLSHLTSEDEEDIRIAKQRLASGGPWFTTAEVLSHLRSLESR